MRHLDSLLIAALFAVLAGACSPRKETDRPHAAAPSPRVGQVPKPDGSASVPPVVPTQAESAPKPTAADAETVTQPALAQPPELPSAWDIAAGAREVDEEGVATYVGNVSFSSPDGTVIECDQAEVTADAKGHPVSAIFEGNVCIQRAGGGRLRAQRAETRYNDKGVAVSFSFSEVEVEVKK